VLNLRKLVKNYKETGALAEQCSIFSFIDDHCFITKTGAVGVVIQLEGIDYECLDYECLDYECLDYECLDYECLDQGDLDSATKRLQTAFKLFGPEFRVYQYLFKSHFQPEPPRSYDNPVVQRAEQERASYFAQKADEMFSIRVFYVLLYQGSSSATKMTFLKTLGSFLSQGPSAGIANLKSLFGTRKEILLIEEEIDRATPGPTHIKFRVA
jgi:type IV secretion system protein VirB4